MIIEKDGKQYAVKENKTTWTVSCEISTAKSSVKSVSVSYTVPKDGCPTVDALKVFMTESGLF